MSDKCQACGRHFDGEYIEFNKERNKDVYRCYDCNGYNYFDVRPVKPKKIKRVKVVLNDEE